MDHKAYAEGREAGHSDYQLDWNNAFQNAKNPYAVGTKAYFDWDSGYADGFEEASHDDSINWNSWVF